MISSDKGRLDDNFHAYFQLQEQSGKGNLAGSNTSIPPSTTMYSDSSSGNYNSYQLDNSQMMIAPGNHHETAMQDMSSSTAAANAYWNSSNLPQHNAYTQLMAGRFKLSAICHVVHVVH